MPIIAQLIKVCLESSHLFKDNFSILNNFYTFLTENLKNYTMLTMNKILTKIQSKVKIQPKNTLIIPMRPLAFPLYFTNSEGLLEVSPNSEKAK
jgi:hypothetical protein